MHEQIETSLNELVDKLSGWLDIFILNLPNLFFAILAFILFYWLSRNIESWSYKGLRSVIREPSIRGLIASMLSIAIIGIGIIIALSILNLDDALKSILAGAGVAGLAVGLALQGTLSDTFSGISLAVKDEVNVGDWVETNGFTGLVTKIDLRNTKVKEADNNVVVIPNKMMLDKPLKNYGLTPRIRTTVECGVDYSSDLEAVREIAIKAVAAVYPPKTGERVEFFYTAFGGSSIDFILRFWADATDSRMRLEQKSEAIIAIKKAFDDNGINIPFPIRTILQEND